MLVTSGWTALNNEVVRVKAATATITLEAIDTTSTTTYPVGSGVGGLKKVLTWVQIPQITDVAFSGGDQNYQDVVFLEDAQGRQIPTDKAAASMVLTVADDPTLAYVPIVIAADSAQTVQPGTLEPARHRQDLLRRLHLVLAAAGRVAQQRPDAHRLPGPAGRSCSLPVVRTTWPASRIARTPRSRRKSEFPRVGFELIKVEFEFRYGPQGIVDITTSGMRSVTQRPRRP
ncbi:phage tail protein [Pseudomonas gorinensis]